MLTMVTAGLDAPAANRRMVLVPINGSDGSMKDAGQSSL
jgi:hypothetical protein